MLTVATLMFTMSTFNADSQENKMKNSNQNVTRKARLYSILAIIVLAVNPAMADAQDSVAVTVAPVKHEQRSQPIRNSGRISQKNEMRLSFKTGGLIERINVEEGDRVISGQILATLDLEEINARQQRAASNCKKAEADLARFNKLYEESLVSLQTKQDAQSARDSAAAELQIVNFNKKLSVIRAPADGRILKRYVESNELINPGHPAFLLASSQQGSVVRVGLIDQDIVKVGIGDPASITLDAYPGRKFTGSVSEVASSTDSGAGTFEVEILIDAQGYSLRSGLIARVEITPVTGDLQYFIPIESVIRADGGLATVFVLDEEKQVANAVQVEVLEFLQDEVAVRGSLKASDKVIKLGGPYLSDGALVSVIAGIQ
jgi:RND family efflux transporter MFP subunit